MAKSIAQIQSQIAKLQKVAEALRAKEVADVVAKIKSMMALHGLTAADLGAGKVVATAKKAIRRVKGAKAANGSKSSKRAKAPMSTKGAGVAKSADAAVSAAAKAVKVTKAKKATKATKPTEAPKAAKPSKAAKRSKSVAASKTTGVVKYRDDAGNAWTGRGTRPKWFLAAVAAGKTPEQLMVA